MSSAVDTSRLLHHVRLMIAQWVQYGGKQDSALYAAYRESVLVLLRASYHCFCQELASSHAGQSLQAGVLEELIKQLRQQDVVSPELAELSILERATNGWLPAMLRDQASSVVAGSIAQSGGLDPEHCQKWLAELQDLVVRLRQASMEW